MNKLPVPADDFLRQAFTQIERMDASNRKVNQDIEVGGNSIFLTAPNGMRFRLVVSNAGVLSAVAA